MRREDAFWVGKNFEVDRSWPILWFFPGIHLESMIRVNTLDENSKPATLTTKAHALLLLLRPRCSFSPRRSGFNHVIIHAGFLMNGVALRQVIFRKLRCWSFNYYFTNTPHRRPPLWSSSQSYCLQIQRPGFDSRSYQIFWEVVGLERGLLSLVSTIEELLGRKSNGSGLESREYDYRDPSRWPRGILYPQKLVLTSPTSSDCSVGIFRSRTQATEYSSVLHIYI
jgi:hypothetical protein